MQPYNYNVKPVDISAYFKGLNQYEQNQMAKQRAEQERQLFDAKMAQMNQPKPFSMDEFKGVVTGVESALKAGDQNLALAIVDQYSTNLPPQAMESVNRFRQAVIQDPQGLAMEKIAGYKSGFPDEKGFAPEVSPPQVDQETGQQYVIYSDRNAGTSERVDIVGGKAMTDNEKLNREIRLKLLKDATDQSKEAFKSFSNVRDEISNLDTVIKQIEKGAETGAIANLFPSLRSSTLALQNAANRLGLNVVGAVTFGALSEKELEMAMQTALPTNMDEVDLKKWALERKSAQQKLAKELLKMATTLGKGKTTVSEYLEANNYRVGERELPIVELERKYPKPPTMSNEDYQEFLQLKAEELKGN